METTQPEASQSENTLQPIDQSTTANCPAPIISDEAVMSLQSAYAVWLSKKYPGTRWVPAND